MSGDTTGQLTHCMISGVKSKQSSSNDVPHPPLPKGGDPIMQGRSYEPASCHATMRVMTPEAEFALECTARECDFSGSACSVPDCSVDSFPSKEA